MTSDLSYVQSVVARCTHLAQYNEIEMISEKIPNAVCALCVVTVMIEERERCAKIAEAIGRSHRTLNQSIHPEIVGDEIAAVLRTIEKTGEAPHA